MVEFSKENKPQRFFHKLDFKQFEYINDLMKMADLPPIPEWYKQFWTETYTKSIPNNRLTYRDVAVKDFRYAKM